VAEGNARQIPATAVAAFNECHFLYFGPVYHNPNAWTQMQYCFLSQDLGDLKLIIKRKSRLRLKQRIVVSRSVRQMLKELKDSIPAVDAFGQRHAHDVHWAIAHLVCKVSDVALFAQDPLGYHEIAIHSWCKFIIWQ